MNSARRADRFSPKRAPMVRIIDHCEQRCRTDDAVIEWDIFLPQLGQIRVIVSAATRGSFALMQQAARDACS